MKIRIGVIGGGFGARVHVPSFRLDPRCEIRAIWSRDVRKGQKIARENKIPIVYSDWRAMIKDPTLDAFSVAVPPRLQAEIAVAVLQLRKPLFLEKPLSAEVRSAQKIRRLARDNKVPVVVDFEFLELDTWKKAVKNLRSGKWGKLKHVVVIWRVPPLRGKIKFCWKDTEKEGGGLLYSFGSHVLYYLESMLGPLVNLKRSPGLEAHMKAQTNSGVPVSIFISRPIQGNPLHQILFLGEKGALRLENDSHDYMRDFRLSACKGSGKYRTILKEKSIPGVHDGRIPAVAHMVRKFIDRVTQKKKGGSSSLERAVRVEKLMAEVSR